MLHQRHQMRMHVNHRDGPKATRDVTYMTIWNTTIARFAPYPPFGVCLHTAHDIDGNRERQSKMAIEDGSRERQARLSRQASAPALERLQAAKSMGGQCGSSWARRSEHVEATLSGWRSVWMESDEPALTQKSWLRTLYFTTLYANFRSRPRIPAKKTAPRGLY